MHSTLTRINNLSALLSSCLMALLAAITVSSLIMEQWIPPVDADLSVGRVMVYPSKTQRYPRKKQEMAFVNFNVTADLTPLFTWNTKQLFLSLEAEYTNSQGVNNTIVLWDRIVRRSADAKVNIVGGKNKYAFREVGGKFKNTPPASYALKYNVMPYVGVLRYGEAARTKEWIGFEYRDELS